MALRETDRGNISVGPTTFVLAFLIPWVTGWAFYIHLVWEIIFG